ncbi:MAG: type II secretion system protein [Sulfuricella sp.]|nr:type II secretion system protein [Sulfuricella sp.]
MGKVKGGSRMPARQSGFTIVELIAVMVIVGVLAATAIPRFFNRGDFDARSFSDQTLSILRYAQKSAIAKHRFVCATFTANSVALTFGATAACGAGLAGPDGQPAPYFVASANASFTATPAALSFDALGRTYDAAGVALAADRVMSVNGLATTITVEAETGYVR